MVITNEMIKESLDLNLSEPVRFENLGFLNSKQPDVLSFIENEKFISQLVSNKNIQGVFVTLELAARISSISVKKIVCDDPRFCFYTLYNYKAKKSYKKRSTIIHALSIVHPRAYVSEYNVQIGENVIVEPNATIMPDVIIGKDCIIGAGSVIGCDDAEINHTSRGIFRVIHDGMLLIGDRVEIGANCTIDKGFSFQNTVIGNDTKIANSTYIGHSVQIGRRCMLLCCSILGSAIICDNARINPRSIISNQITIGEGAVISLGAVVVTSVPAHQKVTGNFAVKHTKFLYNYSKLFGPL